MSITHEIWLRCKTDYLTGTGSLRVVAARHGVAQSSIEKRARKEEWTRLRREFEKCQLEKLLPPAPPSLPPLPMAPDGAVSDEWLVKRVEIYYQRNAELLDKARGLLSKKLADEKNELGTDGLAKLTSALGGIVDAENKLLGLNHRQKGRPRRPAPPICEPLTSSSNPVGGGRARYARPSPRRRGPCGLSRWQAFGRPCVTGLHCYRICFPVW